jgi:hypothetical protein
MPVNFNFGFAEMVNALGKRTSVAIVIFALLVWLAASCVQSDAMTALVAGEKGGLTAARGAERCRSQVYNPKISASAFTAAAKSRL